MSPALTAQHRRRLREVWRSAGWPCQDLLEVELLAAGLLERVRDAQGRGTPRVTDDVRTSGPDRPGPRSPDADSPGLTRAAQRKPSPPGLRLPFGSTLAFSDASSRSVAGSCDSRYR